MNKEEVRNRLLNSVCLEGRARELAMEDIEIYLGLRDDPNANMRLRFSEAQTFEEKLDIIRPNPDPRCHINWAKVDLFLGLVETFETFEEGQKLFNSDPHSICGYEDQILGRMIGLATSVENIVWVFNLLSSSVLKHKCLDRMCDLIGLPKPQ